MNTSTILKSFSAFQQGLGTIYCNSIVDHMTHNRIAILCRSLLPPIPSLLFTIPIVLQYFICLLFICLLVYSLIIEHSIPINWQSIFLLFYNYILLQCKNIKTTLHNPSIHLGKRKEEEDDHVVFQYFSTVCCKFDLKFTLYSINLI